VRQPPPSLAERKPLTISRFLLPRIASLSSVSPNGHVPILVVPYSHTVDETITTKFKAIPESAAITSFLDQASIRSSTHSAPSLSPATVQRSGMQKELIELVHEDKVDPNVLMLSFRDEAERKKGAEGLPGGFLKGRQEALERYAKEVGESDQRLAKFYKDKIAVRRYFLADQLSSSTLSTLDFESPFSSSSH
jgi:glutathione S-transferase